MDKVNQIIHADCLEEMKRWPDACVDSIITDPPYGLSSGVDIYEVMRQWVNGEDYIHSGKGFAGEEWDSFVPGPRIWKECCRVLKPGGHLLAFVSTRTWDLLSIAIRMGGFECRDTIGCPTLAWVTGGGMPKSQNVSKFIDRYLGKEPVVVGKRTDGRNGRPFKQGVSHFVTFSSMKGRIGSGSEKIGQITILATPEGAKWDGWFTSLKPAWEPILVFRKPPDNSVAENVLKYGTGALNIKACSIETQEDLGRFNTNDAQSVIFDGGKAAGPSKQYGVPLVDQRRYPANVILVHHPDCRQVLRNQVQQLSLVGTRGDEQGAVRVWECHTDCQVLALNRQSLDQGIHNAGSSKLATGGEFGGGRSIFGAGMGHRGTDGQRYGDGGGASRFFYCAKSSRSEREEGLRGRIKCVICGETDTETHKDEHGTGRTCIRNDHVTVKPLELMRWLAKLCTPADGVILDPFAGSGTTLIAAGSEGFSFIGIEQDEHYVEIIRARLDHWLKRDFNEGNQLGLMVGKE